VFLTPDGEPAAFVIISSARSGSNLLVGYLRQVTQAACFGEIFRTGFPDKPGWGQLVRRLDLPETARELHTSDVTAFWELVLAAGLRRRRWLGAKAFYYHRRGDPLWDRFAEADHRIIHLWRDSTFDQYVSRLLAVASGEWKSAVAATKQAEPLVTFDRDDYVRYRDGLRADIDATRVRYGGSDRYAEVEYRQLTERGFISAWLEGLFGERIAVEETLRQQRTRPKIEYLRNPEDAEPFTADSIAGGFAET
jgi:hypothetical protein